MTPGGVAATFTSHRLLIDPVRLSQGQGLIARTRAAISQQVAALETVDCPVMTPPGLAYDVQTGQLAHPAKVPFQLAHRPRRMPYVMPC